MAADDEITYFNPWAEIQRSGHDLPHWQQLGATYFITFRMADALPATLRARLAEEKSCWLEQHAEPWDEATTLEYHQRFSGAVESGLDAGHESCFLSERLARDVVAEALRYFDGDRYVLHSAIVMPNHVHCLVSLCRGALLEDVLHSWKSFSAHRIVERFPAAPNPFWQADYFDRLVRDAKHFASCVRYIRKNPNKARVKGSNYDLYEGELARRVE